MFYPLEERAAGLADSALQRAQSRSARQHEAWRVRKDGTRFGPTWRSPRCAGPRASSRVFAKVTRDVSARQRERENELMLAAMFERTPAGIALADVTGRFVRANPVFLRMVGYSAEELAHKTIGDLTHPEDTEDTWRLFDELVQGRRNQAEYRGAPASQERPDHLCTQQRGRGCRTRTALRYIIGMVATSPSAVLRRCPARERGALQAFTQHSRRRCSQDAVRPLSLRERAVPAALLPAPRPGRGHSDDQPHRQRAVAQRTTPSPARGVPIQFEDSAQSSARSLQRVSKFPVDSTAP